MKSLLLLLTVALAPLPATAQTSAPVAPADARLYPGDLIKLWILGEEDWSRDYLVQENGIVSFPHIGDRNVLNVSTRELRDTLLAAFRVYLRDPSIEITFRHKIHILGAVREPGVYHVDRNMSIAEVLAIAKGAESYGKPNEVQLYRNGERVRTKITQRDRIADLPLQSGDQLFVPERSWFARNTPLVATMLSGIISVTIAILTQK